MLQTWKRWQDWVTVVIGVLLFVAPFVLGATANPVAAATGYAGGVLLAIAGLWSLSSPSSRFTEWAEVVVGVLVFIAPWVLGFTGVSAFAWSAWIAGILAIVLGGSVLLGDRDRQTLAAQH